MKKLFNHTKKPYQDWNEYEENTYDWDMDIEDDVEEISEDRYYAEEDAETVFEDAEPVEDYYVEDGAEAAYAGDANGETYYAEEGAETAYADTVNEEAYYAEDGAEAACAGAGAEKVYYTEENSETVYSGSENEEAYYVEEEEAYYADEPEEEAYAAPRATHKRTAPPPSNTSRNKKRGGIFANMSTMDKIITATGAAVLVLALVTGGMYVSAKLDKDALEAFANVGTQLDGIQTIGEEGLLAVADAEQARLAAAEVIEEEDDNTGYDEEDFAQGTRIECKLTSVMKDLKIKFTNKETGKLVANVPFAVTVTGPDGKSSIWTDDDMDGIIYKKDIAAGTYQIAMNELTDNRYADYTFSTSSQSVEVKKDINYKKVDVKDEIKKESEIDASKEDTKKNETTVESTLKDTVAWVESTSTANTYTEVAKNTIPDPTLLAFAGDFTRMAYTAGISPSSKELAVGEDFTLTAVCPDVELTNVVWTSSRPDVVSVTGNGVTATATGLKEDTAPVMISFTADGSAVSGGDAVTGLTGTCVVTMTKAPAKAGTVSVDNPELLVGVGVSEEVLAKAAGFAEGREIVYTVASNKNEIATATVDQTGKITVTGVAAGEAVITVTANYKDGTAATAANASIKVTVPGKATITLEKKEATVYLTTPLTLKVTIANAVMKNPITAETSDANIALVEVKDRTITITGVNPGTAVITVKYVENNEEVKATCAVTVKTHPKDEKTKKLKNADGEQLYVVENKKYREAVYADYYTAEKFFIKGEAKYTGWQTLDGKVYFFDASGKKVTGEQVIQGAKYNFASDGSLVTGSGTLGIDVSKWNGSIDWKAVKNSGVSYVIIRSGYRGSSQGSLIEDPKFTKNIKGATEAGLKVGVYFFTQAVDEVEAVEEASMVLEQVKNYKISYPIFLDVESSGGGRGDQIDKATRTAVCKAFCETIKAGGYTAGIYANKSWLTEKIDASSLSAYKIWLAQYASEPTYAGRYDLWQYKSTGKVSGISGDVDLNLSYLGY